MKNILIIDDNVMLCRAIASFVGTLGNDYATLTAEDGEKGVEILGAQPVNLILTDIEMPRMNGYQVIDYAKKNHPSVPVIVMTGSWTNELQALVHKTGVARFLEKPFRFGDLAEIIHEALGKDSVGAGELTHRM